MKQLRLRDIFSIAAAAISTVPAGLGYLAYSMHHSVAAGIAVSIPAMVGIGGITGVAAFLHWKNNSSNSP